MPRVAALRAAAAVGVALVALVLTPAVSSAAEAKGPGAPSGLTVNGMKPATGVDPDALSFAWRVNDARPGAEQRGYRVLVTRSPSTDPQLGAVLWDSGAVGSAQQAFVSYSGPRLDGDRQYWWTVATRGAGGPFGPFARPSSFITVPRPSDWHAQWVAPGESPPTRDQYTYVRKVARVRAGPIVRATAYVAASQQYQLWINGRRADAGPSFSYPDEQYVQATDVTSLVRPDAPNAVGVLHHWYGAGQGRPASTPGLLVEISVVHRDGTREVVGSDGSWRQRPAEWVPGAPRNDEGDFTEVIDGRAHPAGWSTSEFDDARWQPLDVLGPPGVPPFTHLNAQRTRIATRAVSPVSVRRLASGAVIADYGAIYAATPVVRFHHGSSGRPIDIRVGFALDADGRVSTTHLNQGTDMGYRYTERGGRETFDPFGYLAFQYLEIDRTDETLDAKQLSIETRHSAMPDDHAAKFASSDATLDATWGLTRRSAMFASQEQFVDTPTREKGQFLLDSYDDSLATTRAFGEQNLTWQALRDFARSQDRYWPDGRLNVVYPNGDGARDIPDDTERYPDWVWEYFLATGDRSTLTTLAPVATRVAAYVASSTDPATGLVTRLPGGGADYLYGAVDWPPPMRYGYDMNTVARTTVNALAVNAYDAAARMADVLGDPASAASWRGRRDALVAAMNARLRRPDGVYVDGLEPDGSMSGHASQQASAFALAYGVVPGAQRSAVGAYVSSLGIALGPDNGLVLLRALHAADRDADVRRILTDRSLPGWAHIVAAGGSFTWETWAPEDAESDSTSHGWGSSALAAFPETFLGIDAAAPDSTPTGARLDLHEPLSGPSHVAGTVPTVSGPVSVEWRRTRRGVDLRLRVPPNASLMVRLRARGTGHVTQRGSALHDGPGVRVVGTRSDTVDFAVGSGSYSFHTT